MRMARKRFDKEFRDSAVEKIGNGKTLKETACEIGISVSSLRRWRKDYIMRLEEELEPNERIQKILISSTCEIRGEYKCPFLLITNAWTPMSSVRGMETPVSRHAYVVSVRTPFIRKAPGVVIPEYSFIGDTICAYLSVLYGKRFDNHGSLENCGSFRMPDLTSYFQVCDHRLPFNSYKERKTIPIELIFSKVSIIEKIIHDKCDDDKFARVFAISSKSYLQALQTAEQNIETAYLHLITACETMSSYFEYEKEELISTETLTYLRKISDQMEDGEAIVKQLKKQLFSIKRKFTRAICDLVSQDFFDNPESKRQSQIFKEKDFEKSVKAAYDVRSDFVHSGTPFGGWVRLHEEAVDLRAGKPYMPSRKEDTKKEKKKKKSYSKTLQYTPTFTGMERIVRYCLLKFLKYQGIIIAS